jgi:hypothetical protein
MALQDAFANRERNAAGDYSPDPKATRFPPQWTGTNERGGGRASITALAEGWWVQRHCMPLSLWPVIDISAIL